MNTLGILICTVCAVLAQGRNCVQTDCVAEAGKMEPKGVCHHSGEPSDPNMMIDHRPFTEMTERALTRARQLERDGRLDEALAEYMRVNSTKHPLSVDDVHETIVRLAFQVGRYETALAEMEQAPGTFTSVDWIGGSYNEPLHLFVSSCLGSVDDSEYRIGYAFVERCLESTPGWRTSTFPSAELRTSDGMIVAAIGIASKDSKLFGYQALREVEARWPGEPAVALVLSNLEIGRERYAEAARLADVASRRATGDARKKLLELRDWARLLADRCNLRQMDNEPKKHYTVSDAVPITRIIMTGKCL